MCSSNVDWPARTMKGIVAKHRETDGGEENRRETILISNGNIEKRRLKKIEITGELNRDKKRKKKSDKWGQLPD